MTDVIMGWVYLGFILGASAWTVVYVLLFQVPEWIERRRKEKVKANE